MPGDRLRSLNAPSPGWSEQPVPSNWTMHGHDRPHYTNVRMPFDTPPSGYGIDLPLSISGLGLAYQVRSTVVGVDPKSPAAGSSIKRDDVIAIMRRMQDEQAVSFIFSTHDQHLISHAEDTFTIRDGVLEEAPRC